MSLGDEKPPTVSFNRSQRRRRMPLRVTIAVILAVVIGFVAFASLWTEVLWFDQLGYSAVFRTQLVTQLMLFVVTALITAAIVAAGLYFAFRSRPMYAPTGFDASTLEHYRGMLDPLRKAVLWGVPLGAALLTAPLASQQWKTYLLWRNAVSFGQKDPQFGIDASFYIFSLPWWQLVVSLLTVAVVLAAMASLATHYIYGGLRLQGPGPRLTQAARVQLFTIGAALMLLRAIDYWLNRYQLTTNQTKVMTGLGYTEANAVLPAQGILSAICLVLAILFVVAVVVDRFRLVPLYGLVLLLICVIVIGGIYPALVRNFKVKPNEQPLEAQYVSRSIAATRTAYGLDRLQTSGYNPSGGGAAQNVQTQLEQTPGIRLIDPAIVSDTFKQIEQKGQFYKFVDQLDLDRYPAPAGSGSQTQQDSVVAVRELNVEGLPLDKRNWYNDHVVYTHGYGLVTAPVNKKTDRGVPDFSQNSQPDKSVLGKYEPRVYFGEDMPSYSVVGGPKGGVDRELDYPDRSSETEKMRYTTYQGKGGVAIGSMMRKLMYAIKFQDQNVLLSDNVTDKSRIIYDRNPRERVAKVAPFLTLDGNAYPSVVDGRITWIVDGYTTSARYPYSDLQQVRNITSDSVTSASSVVSALEGDQLNYVRNSVKATVDAYDGSVTLYAWDDQDPILRAWRKVFPTEIKPMSQMSSQLMSHVRYPEDLFKLQRSIVGRYHVNSPADFFNGNDYWKVPLDPTVTNPVETQAQPAYYQSMKLPGYDKARYSITSTYIPMNVGTEQNRDILTGFLVADSDAGAEAGKRRSEYGALRLLTMPDNTSGPGQVQNQLKTNEGVARKFSDLNIVQGGTAKIEWGNLLTVPLAQGIFYVQPIYVRGKGTTSYPTLDLVLVSFKGSIGHGKTLAEAVKVMSENLGTDSTGTTTGAATPSAGATASPSASQPAPAASGAGSPAPSPSASTPAAANSPEVRQALAEANQAMKDADAALKAGDFTKYGQAQAALKAALEKATKLSSGG